MEDAKYQRSLRQRTKGFTAESEEQLRKKRRLGSDAESTGLQTAFTLESRVPAIDIQMFVRFLFPP